MGLGKICVTCFTTAIKLSLAAFLLGVALWSVTPQTAQTAERSGQTSVGSIKLSTFARGLALKRYQSLQSLEPTFGFFPLKHDVWPGEHYQAVFPVGRASRIYLFLWYHSVPKGDEPLIMCFDQKKGKDKLVYKVRIASVDRPPSKIALARNLLDFLKSSQAGTFAIAGTISPYAYRDLVAHRDYALYDYDVNTGDLHVSLLSNPAGGTTYKTGPQDPASGPTKFYEEYGLPVTKEELELICKGQT